MKNERKRVSTRLGAGLLAVVLACAGLAITSGTATATQTVTQSTRIAGVDKYATSASAAITSHSGNATASVLVSGESYADGLSAAALAGAVSGPVIITDPDALKGSTSLAIGQINSTTAAGHTVYIVGGTSAVSANVATQLTDLGYTVSRVSGADRVATADAVATKIRTLQDFGTSWGTSMTTVFLTTARNFADAVCASGLAHQKVSPILLVDTAADGTTAGTALSAGTSAVLDSAVNSIERVIILGGTAAVSAEVGKEGAGVIQAVPAPFLIGMMGVVHRLERSLRGIAQVYPLQAVAQLLTGEVTKFIIIIAGHQLKVQKRIITGVYGREFLVIRIIILHIQVIIRITFVVIHGNDLTQFIMVIANGPHAQVSRLHDHPLYGTVKVIEALENLAPDELSPRQALDLIYTLKRLSQS